MTDHGSMTDSEIVAHSLEMWANYIETGKPALSAQDAIRSRQLTLLRPLDEAQRRLVARIRDLAADTLRAQSRVLMGGPG